MSTGFLIDLVQILGNLYIFTYKTRGCARLRATSPLFSKYTNLAGFAKIESIHSP